jgi:formyl-CoA transferase
LGAASRSGPLAGLRIIDLSSVVLGPLATQILGDYGADVIKVESLEGDLIRTNGVSRHPGMSSIHLSINRNKRSLSIDLKSPEGVEVVRRLVAGADALVHNMRVEAIERLGFGYEAVAALRPDIVYAVATGFGQDGPDRARPAFDDVIQAGCGLVSLSEVYAERPDFMPSLIADKATGMALVNAVLAALLHRARTGEGQMVEVPMLETMAAFTLAEHMGGLCFEPHEGPAGYQRILKGGRRPMQTKDGWLAVLPYTGDHWAAFLDDVGRADLVPVAADRHSRATHIHELYAVMTGAMLRRTTAEWMATCDRLDIPATRVFGLDELPDHPQLKAVGFFVERDHPSEGRIRETKPPTRFAKTPATIARPAPRLGEQSREILADAGLDDAAIQDLVARRIVICPQA